MKRILITIQLLIIVGAVALGSAAVYQCGRDLWAVGVGIHIIVASMAAMWYCVLSYIIHNLKDAPPPAVPPPTEDVDQ